MKARFYLLVCFTFTCAISMAQGQSSTKNYTLPQNDHHYRMVKDWIEDNVDPDYSHASETAIEAFRDIKFGVRIHWGLYSVTAKGGESWPCKMAWIYKIMALN